MAEDNLKNSCFNEENIRDILKMFRSNTFQMDFKQIKELTNMIERENPSILFKKALDEALLKVFIFMKEHVELNIHKIFIDGKSAIHYLFHLNCTYDSDLRIDNYLINPNLDLEQEKKSSKYHAYDEPEAKSVINFFLKDSEENHCDDHGFTCLHGACFSGDVEVVKRFVSQGVDVNVDSYTCSPLHIACKYRRVDVVKVLLENGAEPNRLDKEDKSTPLHALARLRVCDCAEFCTDNIDDDKKEKKRRPVEEIVDLLVAKGANIETRNARGFTPLESAVSLLDYELTKSLLERGASLDSLRENITFSIDYTSSELKNYPITLYIAEMIRLLSSNGFYWNVYTRLKILKFFMKYRDFNIKNLIVDNDITFYYSSRLNLINIECYMSNYKAFGFYLDQVTADYLHKKREESKLIAYNWAMMAAADAFTPSSHSPRGIEVEKIMKGIMVNKDVSLLRICQMSYGKASSILSKIKDYRLPALKDFENNIQDIIKKHIANVLLRPQFELLAADLFMTDHCQLKLPYTACRIIAGHMSDEDLLRLCERTKESDLE
ncbi:hypothetical protein TKK_0003196 [Trichogramma kaykai]